MRRSRRRNRSTWFPIVPTVYGETTPPVTWYETYLPVLDGSEPGDTVLIAIPLTLDRTQSVSQQDDGTSLRDYVEGQDYLLERVVGKVWFAGPTVNGSAGRFGIGCIALAILPSSNDAEGPDLPEEEYNPLFARNAQQPWLWRRTWRLTNPNTWPTPKGILTDFPATSAGYGSVAEGGHLDTKGVKRRVTKEHRLYLIAAYGLIESGGAEADSCQIGYDLRVLGSMRRGKNTSSF